MSEPMITNVFNYNNPSETDGIKVVKCCVCKTLIEVRKDSINSFRAMCSPCGDDFVGGKIDSVTWYDGKRR